MTPKEKARQLYETYLIVTDSRVIAKICAFCAVNEILNQDKGAFDLGEIHYHFEYWGNVKQEIEKL